ncbi:MAG TPA: NADPH-dependent FMN reductase [Kiritimatiellia bacterium]|nr:NADPH-dependent FMN reductase [Kiritimatiellia bacterium]
MNNIVCISGTSRPDNYTVRALAIVTDEFSKRDIPFTAVDARELNLSFPGHPPTPDAKRMAEAVKNASGVILATPEYHGSFCAMMKLIIENMGFPSALAGKPVALLGVAAGRIGAIKSIEQLKGVCSHVGAIVVPGAVSIAGVQSAFDADGSCKDPAVEKALRGLAESLQGFMKEYVCPKFALEEMVRGNTQAWTTQV